MTVDDLPDLHPPDHGSVRDPSRPILSFAWRTDGAHGAASHVHSRAHVIQPTAGALWATTPEGTWLVPEGQALWIPPRVHHDVYSQAAVAARVLFVDEERAAPLPPQSGTVRVSPMLSALIGRAIEHGNDYPPEGPAARLALVALDELARLEFAPVFVPVSKDPRLGHVMRRFVEDPAAPVGFEQAAVEAGASPRTLARLFRLETGLTFSQWKTRLVLVKAMERLARGDAVSAVAMDLGYGSTSSFVYMFRSNLGVSPGRYRARRTAG